MTGDSVIIDSHAHFVGGPGLHALWTALEAAGTYGPAPTIAGLEDGLREGVEKQIRLMDEVGTDLQLTSPRPFVLKHSHRPGRIVHSWARVYNDAIAYQVGQQSGRVLGVGALPQVDGAPITEVFDELDRVVDDLGFVGVLLNPDPSEGAGTSPVLGDEYWYPLYERLQAMDVPVLLHSAGCYGRENYSEHFISEESLAILSVIRAGVFRQFPGLKIVVPHGGGSIPYQIGRWMAHDRTYPEAGREPFEESLRRFWFDTCLYTPAAIALLVETVGADRVLFGTERPGSGAPLDDLKPVIEAIPGFSAADRSAIFAANARTVYSRVDKLLSPAGKAIGVAG
jgi:4-oxalmesaconate hydratase